MLGNLKQQFKKIDSRRLSRPDSLVKEIGAIVVKNCFAADRAFITKFIETQMFTTYIEENF